VKRLELSPLAERDIEEIGDWISRDSPQRAFRFIRSLREKCGVLRERPEAAPARPELGQGIRVLRHRNHLIFYRIEKDAIRVERVLHGARDLLALVSGGAEG